MPKLWTAMGAVLVAFACSGSLAQGAPPPVGGLTPLSGTAGCYTATTVAGCTTDARLAEAEALAISPTGNALYVISKGTSPGEDELLAYARNATTGAITGFLDCYGFDGDDGCTSEPGLYGVGPSIAVGPGDVGVYVTTSEETDTAGAVLAFNTNSTTGALTGVNNCYWETSAENCTNAAGFQSAGIHDAKVLALSPDGDFLYVAGSDPGSLAVFRRDPQFGSLDGQISPCFTGGVDNQTPYPDPGCTDHATPDTLLADASSIAVGPNAVYVVSDDADGDGTLEAYARNSSTGQITGAESCLTANASGTHGCTYFASLAAGTNGSPIANEVALAPGGASAYMDDSQIADDPVGAVTAISLSGGDLEADLGCIGQLVGACPSVTGITVPEGMAFSPDGSDLYLAGSGAGHGGFLDALAIGAQGFSSSPLLSCTASVATTGCTTDAPALGSYAVAVSPDGKFVYDAAYNPLGNGAALLAFTRQLAPTCQATSVSTTAGVAVPVGLSCTASGISIVSGPANGKLSTVANGSVTYTPNANFVGNDSFTFDASDGTNVATTVTATITVAAAVAATTSATTEGNTSGTTSGSGAGTGAAPPVLSPPSSKITAPATKIAAKRLKAISGTAAGVTTAVAYVDVGVLMVVKTGRGSHAKTTCRYLASSERLVSVAPLHNVCAASHFLRASGTTKWTLKLKHALPAGSYTFFSEAVGVNGKSELVTLGAGAADVRKVRVT